jgi:hypothetical protein
VSASTRIAIRIVAPAKVTASVRSIPLLSPIA